MLAKRIIPCLDVKGGRVVKGVQFVDHVDAGDPVSMAAFYDSESADELVFYDITASSENRNIILDVVRKVAEQVFIPLTVGGGLRSVKDMQEMLQAGADKVSLNTAAVENPNLIKQGAEQFGSQCIVLGLDAVRASCDDQQRWEVRVRTGNGGGVATDLDAITWAKQAVELGAGEIVANSIDADGTQKGYDLDLLKLLSEAVTVPVVASGGAGNLDPLHDALELGKADAVLAASIFHFGIHRIPEAKEFLLSKGVPIRP